MQFLQSDLSNKISNMSQSKVMLLMSDSTSALAVQQQLAELGYAAADVCKTLEEAIDCLERAKFNLVLVDSELEGATPDGFMAARIILDRFGPAIIILCNPEDRLVAVEGIPPFQAILIKPLDLKALAANIELAKLTRSAMRQLQREIERVPTFYRSLVNTTPDAIYLSGIDQQILLANQSGYQILGYQNEDEILDKNFLDLLIPQERLRAQEMSRKLLEKQQPGANFEFRMLCKNGRQIEVESNISVMWGENGSPEFFLTIARDISSRKKVELELRQSMAELARSNAIIAALSQVATRIETTSNPDQIFETLGYELKQLGMTCLVTLTDAEPLLEMSYTSFPPGLLDQIEQQTGIRVNGFSFPIQTNAATTTLPSNQAIFYPDVLPILFQAIPEINRENAERAVRLAGISPFTPIICLPLMVHEKFVGNLSVLGPGLRKADIPAFSIFATQLAVAIDKARLFETVQRQAVEAETLRQAASVVNSALDLQHVLDRILTELNKVVYYDSVAVFFVEEDHLRIVALRGFPNPERFLNQIFPVEDPLLQEVKESGGPLILFNAQEDPRFEKWAGTEYVHGWLGVPLFAHGNCIGFLTLDNRQAGAYNADTAKLALVFANQAAIAIENARLFEQVQRLAVTDPLTNLHNRRYFFEVAHREMERARRYQSPLSLIMIDIDRFKEVNDTHGHLIGDMVLKQIADRMNAQLREIDVLCRYGGEEFVILLPDTALDAAYQVAERLRHAIVQMPIQAEGFQVEVTTSLGVAHMDADCLHIDDLIRYADQALYQAKAAGRNQSILWDKFEGTNP
jgi:diguanylate cyclase (GGDEF)-like protein/PAS domain S-box-containing protein